MLHASVDTAATLISLSVAAFYRIIAPLAVLVPGAQ
jgi:hypothetical protein